MYKSDYIHSQGIRVLESKIHMDTGSYLTQTFIRELQIGIEKKRRLKDVIKNVTEQLMNTDEVRSKVNNKSRRIVFSKGSGD